MRTLTCAAAVAAASALFLAAPAHATPPGDNGTVKIHDAGTGEELRKNEPHVCTFYLDAFGFDAGQTATWWIESWAPTAGVKGEKVKSGSLTPDAEGHGRTQDLSLPDGHYKLFWTFDGEHGRAKHKVFWTDCEDGEEGGEPTAPAPSASEPSSPGKPETPGKPGAPEPSESSAAPAPSATPPSGQGGGDLAETGSSAPVVGMSVAAAALLGVGGWLVARRRRAGAAS
ncbi:LPXTG cell wall anchor domain-containing protein [Streptomyces sp. Da 82-17]|uniref:LPXTG cell wall anchor domain-containing protein n=1 Tax=Streptomyces sp. Da 82-17 TaxID=3377116 RepID=UPI0038D431FF